MKLETFFEKFELFAEAPNSVAKMRELVLELAADGRLCTQDSSDDPASVLLFRISETNKSRYESGEIRLRKHANGVKDAESRCIPNGWTAVNLGEIADVNWGNTSLTKKSYSEEGYTAYSATGPDGLIKHAEFSEPGIVLSAIGARSGKCFLATGKWTAIKNTITIIPFAPINNDWLFRVINRERVWKKRGGAQPFIALKDAIQLRLSLPPLAEQKRIVAKVDELMALCDRLEEKEKERETQHTALARASLARFADAPTPANLNLIFHKSFSVPPSDLRKNILTLAVQGKLVPQGLNDEPVNDLLEELAGLKKHLLEERKIRNQKVVDAPIEPELPFPVPDNWHWIRLGHAVTLLGGYAYESSAYVPESSNQIIRLGNVKNDRLLLDQKPAFISDALAKQTSDYKILAGDILVTMTGTKAKRDYAFTLVVKPNQLEKKQLFLNQRVGAIRPFLFDLVPLINVFLKSDQLLDLIFATATGTANQANVGTPSILNLPFPLPPLAEQYRIVAKVHQLMAMVDLLETQLATARATATALLEDIVAQLSSTG
jgi:type I restriction enzyme, S subunit